MPRIPSIKPAKEIIVEAAAKQIAILIASGKSVNSIAKELKISYNKVKNIMETYHFKKHLLEYQEEFTKMARTKFARGADELVEMALNVVREHLENGNLQAVPMVMKMARMDQAGEDTNKQETDTVIQVVLPSAPEKIKSIETTAKKLQQATKEKDDEI